MRAFVGLLFISVVLCGLDMDSCIYKGDKTYDLSQLSGTDMVGSDSSGQEYHVRMCKSTPKCDNANPNAASVCQLPNSGGAKNAGATSTMNVVEVTDGLKISFSGGTVGCGNYARTTVVNLKCGKGNSAITSVSEQSCAYTIEATSPFACGKASSSSSKGGLSAGSVILIIVACLIAVYLAGGIVYNWKFQEKTGVQMIPNLDFWTDLPSLVKDGFMFAIHGFKKDSGYSPA